eukprot:CAMPEP_0171623016 /NCGR_PEP_ID=MMETSP0990-20121206/17642_1 /TAXON_ID=483369 /ORGANISM="non described non described, Strain CCMP2098" /LENGTH=75 /DNA_ID=CAMNT_0012189033 /DNA_START=211 /DNA_END=438 /DNA_ORIENTATION=+
MVLEDTHERHIAGGKKSDFPLGLFLVRGDTVVLLGEIDAQKEAALGLKEVAVDEVLEAEKKLTKIEWDFEKLERL